MITCSLLLSTQLNEPVVSHALTIGLIIVLGIPHGATDHVLDHFQQTGKFQTRFSGVFIGKYLLLIAAYSLVWWLLPLPALLLFLLISAYHFGQTQLFNLFSGSGWHVRVAYLSWGTALLCSLFGIHYADTAFYLKGIVSLADIPYLQAAVMVLLVIAILGYISTLVAEWQDIDFRKAALLHLLELGALTLLFSQLNLLLSFALFFGLWHATDAFKLQLQTIRSKHQLSTMQLVKAALPFSLLSLVGIGILISAYTLFPALLSPFTLLFILISLLTLPHVVVVERFYKSGPTATPSTLSE